MKNILGQGISADGKRTMKKQHLTENQIEFLGPHAETFLNYLEEQIQKQDFEESEFNAELDEVLEEMGFTGEARVKCRALFMEAVQNNTSKLQNGIAEIVGQYFSVEGDVVDTAAARTSELEEAILKLRRKTSN